MPTIYNSTTAEYEKDGRKITDRTIQLMLRRNSDRTKNRIRALTRLLLNSEISIAQWESEMASIIAELHIGFGMVGAGGRQSLTQSQLNAIEENIRAEIGYLVGFAEALINGTVSDRQAEARAASYANAAKKSWGVANLIAKRIAGFDQAWRETDPMSEHCPSCPSYATGGWVPIDEVVAIGADCECGGNCRCNIRYRRSISPSITEAVLRPQEQGTIARLQRLLR